MRTISADRIEPTRDLLLVKKYRRPERHGLIHLPEPWQEDSSGNLWELAGWNEEAAEVLGVERLPVGTIFKIRLSAPGDPGAAFTGYHDAADDRMLFVMDPEKIYSVIRVEEGV